MLAKIDFLFIARMIIVIQSGVTACALMLAAGRVIAIPRSSDGHEISRRGMIIISMSFALVLVAMLDEMVGRMNRCEPFHWSTPVMWFGLIMADIGLWTIFAKGYGR